MAGQNQWRGQDTTGQGVTTMKRRPPKCQVKGRFLLGEVPLFQCAQAMVSWYKSVKRAKDWVSENNSGEFIVSVLYTLIGEEVER